MLNIKIRRPQVEDKEELHNLFKLVLTDTFIKEGIENNIQLLEEEIECKKKYLQHDLDSNGKLRYFLIAEHNEKIIGTIEYGRSSDLINNCTNEKLAHLVEVGTVFVRPDYQRQGVGNLLLNAMFEILKDRGKKEFCLDSGYPNAQKIWMKKFGTPDYYFENYWGENLHHMIWRIAL